MSNLCNGLTLDGRYVLGDEIARGGFGAVWSARHNRTEQEVAIKVLTVNSETAQDGAVERFLREVKTTAALRHPNTVRVFDFGGGDNGVPLYLVMERLHGPNLEDVLRAMKSRSRVMSERAAIDIAVAVLGSLAEAHAEGLVHRDLKPGNVMLNQVAGNVPVVKVLDFGCSYVRGSTLTNKGAVFGTLGYMSPEQIRGMEVDARSDLFSLGLILFRAVTGEMPFASDNNVTLLYQYASVDVPDPRDIPNTQVTDAFADVINMALARDRDRRYANAANMRNALLSIRPSVRRRPAFTDSDLNSPLRRTQVPESIPRASGELGALIRAAEQNRGEGVDIAELNTESDTAWRDKLRDSGAFGVTDQDLQRLGLVELDGAADLPTAEDAPRPHSTQQPSGAAPTVAVSDMRDRGKTPLFGLTPVTPNSHAPNKLVVTTSPSRGAIRSTIPNRQLEAADTGPQTLAGVGLATTGSSTTDSERADTAAWQSAYDDVLAIQSEKKPPIVGILAAVATVVLIALLGWNFSGRSVQQSAAVDVPASGAGAEKQASAATKAAVSTKQNSPGAAIAEPDAAQTPAPKTVADAGSDDATVADTTVADTAGANADGLDSDDAPSPKAASAGRKKAISGVQKPRNPAKKRPLASKRKQPTPPPKVRRPVPPPPPAAPTNPRKRLKPAVFDD